MDGRVAQRKRRRHLFIFLFVILSSLVGFRLWKGRAVVEIISPIPEEPHQSGSIFSVFTKRKSPEDLKRRIQELVNNRWKNYSVYVKDLNTSFTMGLNENIIYTAASLYKVPALAVLYYEAQRGTIDLDERVTVQPQDIQDFGTGSIRYDPPGSVYSIKTLAKLMIQQSDNTAGYVLANHVVGMARIQKQIEAWGLTQTDMVTNKTSNRDIAILFEKIYTGKVTNQAATLEMLSFFKDTEFENRLPALLPSGVEVYHKIGNETRVVHDVGIVTDGKKTYYIGILSTDVPDETEADKIAAQISKLVYEYLR